MSNNNKPLEYSDNGDNGYENKENDPKEEERNRKLGESAATAETLDDLRQQYDDIMEQLDQAQLRSSWYYRGPLAYPSMGNVYDCTSVEEARTRLSKLKKAIAISEQMEKLDISSFTDEEKRGVGLEIVNYLRANEDQLDMKYLTIYKDKGGDYDCALSGNGRAWWEFWHLKNDNMSSEAWAYYSIRGAYVNPPRIDEKTGEPYPNHLLPGVSEYFKELSQLQSKQRRKGLEVEYPEIFVNPNEELMKKEIEKVMGKIDSRKIHNILVTYQKEGCETGNIELVRLLSGAINIDPPPEIFYIEDHGYLGQANYYDNKIFFNTNSVKKHREFIDNELGEDIPDYFKKRVEAQMWIGLIAHEMWHFHQADIRINGPESHPLRDKYSINRMYYINPEDDYEGYENQILEQDAKLASAFFENECDRILREKGYIKKESIKGAKLITRNHVKKTIRTLVEKMPTRSLKKRRRKKNG